MRWRWDQGRLEYFRYDNIRKIARVLYSLNRTRFTARDHLRRRLENETGLRFLPLHYTVWRNYGRTLQCSLLAARVGNRLRTTDVCAKLANEVESTLGADEYFALLIQRFYLPFPAFVDYSTSVPQQFPFCAVIRFLLSKVIRGLEPSATLDEIFSFVVGNECRGDEPLKFYSSLSATGRTPIRNERRQVREMLIVASQFSYLKWFNNRLELDVGPEEKQTINLLKRQAMPIIQKRVPQRGREILRLGTLAKRPALMVPERGTAADISFTEGKRARRTHLRIERNQRLRKEVFKRTEPPYKCDVCGYAVNERYPWVDNILQIHHLLPLNSPMRIGTKGTSLSDIVILCPNCQDAVHRYYKIWLSSRGQEDFRSDDEARQAYEEAKRLYVPD